jgi:alkyl hydroperoxide reductase subunit AhpC
MKIGETAPDFEAETTEGRIRFYDWIGNSWAVLFSHPKDFTPVCTTELGYMAKIKPEFDRRNVRIMGLSVDSTGDHKGWTKDIEETQGHAPNYPIVGDADFKISKLYGMLPADVEGDPKKRTPADNATVRNVYVVGPDKKDQADPDLPHDNRSQFRRSVACDRLLAVDLEVSGSNARELEARRRCDHRGFRVRRGGQEALSPRVESAQAVPSGRAATAIVVGRFCETPLLSFIETKDRSSPSAK